MATTTMLTFLVNVSKVPQARICMTLPECSPHLTYTQSVTPVLTRMLGERRVG